MTTANRLEKLELALTAAKRGNRRLLAVVALAVMGCCLVLAWPVFMPSAQAQGVDAGRIIRARAFIVEDENGKTRAMLNVNDSGPALIMVDAKGMPRVGLTVRNNRASLDLLDAAGEIRAMLVVLEEGPVLSIDDENGEACAILRVDKNGPRLTMFDKRGKVLLTSP